MSRGSSPLRSNLRYSLIDGAFFSVMVGAGETYIPAFALAVGLSEVFSGLIATVPQIVGGVLQLVSPRGVRRLHSNRRWVVYCAIVQGLSFVPLCIAAILGWLSAPAAFFFVSLYWGAGLATGPAWNTWIGRLVPPRIRAAYFARRTRIAHMAVMIGLLGGGFVLQTGSDRDFTLLAFAALFAVSGACRLVSAGYLAAQTEPPWRPDEHAVLPLRRMISQSRRSGHGLLLSYLLVIQVIVQLSGPYFTPYMLKQLQMPYGVYMAVAATSYLAKIVTMPLWAALTQRFGTRFLLWVGGLGLIPLPGLWILSDSLAYLLAVQLLGGAAWAAYELASFLLLFETIPAKDRTSVLTLFNVGNAAALVAGSLLGGFILDWFEASRAGYLTLFGLSSGLRVLTVFMLARIREEVRHPSTPATRTLAVDPTGASLERPILASIPEQDEGS